ncbi:MAG: hypothetical protein ACQEP9_06770 [Bacillota bacterium]
MEQFLKNSSLVLLIILLTAGTVSANLASNSNQVDVNCKIDKHVEINCEDIEEDDWVKFDEPHDDSVDSLMYRLLRNQDTTSGAGSSFTGKGGEVKWARQEITVKTNTPFYISASADYPKHSGDNNSTLNSEYGKPSTFYSYIVPKKFGLGCFEFEIDFPVQIVPGESPRKLKQNTTGTRKYILASKVAMPEEFWEVKSGKYVGNVTFTVQAR